MNKSIIKITAIEGNTQRLDGGSMFGNAPKAVWSRWVEDIDEFNRIKLQCRCMLVELNDLKILVETGIGNFFEPKLQKRYGVVESAHMLTKNLNGIGVNEEDIDYVFLTHLHFDHAGGLIKKLNNKIHDLYFPNAKIITSAQHWVRALSPHPRDKASFIPGLCETLLKNKNLFLIKEHEDLVKIDERLNFIRLFISQGHTPGLLLPTFQGEKESITFMGDLIPGTPWVHLPICMGYDRYPECLINEKKSFYESINSDAHWLFYTHDEKVAFSKIKINSKGNYEASVESCNKNLVI
jgi:glyoxylase-like metal-dependent hydrolase (beta-lactamase superfamily II)